MDIKEKILLFLQEKKIVSRGISVQELSNRLSMDQATEFKKLIKEIAELERTQTIEIDDSGKLHLTHNPAELTGIFRSIRNGSGYISDQLAQGQNITDVFVDRSDLAGAMNGDLVAYELKKQGRFNQHPEGKITRIITRAMTQCVGIFLNDQNKDGFVIPIDKKMQLEYIFVDRKLNVLHPQNEDIVLIEITKYPDRNHDFLSGIIKQIYGNKKDPRMDTLSLVYAAGFTTEFPEEVEAEAAQISEKISKQDLKSRHDLRHEFVITIDGADSKDLDDAISACKLENGNFKLMVHIADVSHYVRSGTKLDQEAYLRGNSTYLVDQVIPMLPEKLSNGICSLNPNVDRLTMTCEMIIDPLGNLQNYKIYPSVINSNYRLTYDYVNDLLADSKHSCDHELETTLQEMRELHQILAKMRQERGSIDFDTQETQIITNSDGQPLELKLRTRGIAERMIESFMLVANETVASLFAEKDLPFLYRVHEQPKSDRLTNFLNFLTLFGIEIKGTTDQIDPKQLQEVLTEIEGQEYQPMVQMMMLRSMQQARYSHHNHGHFGLSSTNYTHFTSPIRRFADLTVHRLLKLSFANKLTPCQPKITNELKEIAQHISATERKSIDLERDVIQLKKVQYMEQFVGEDFTGVISGVTRGGLFIELDNTVEGFVSARELIDDYYQFVERSMTLVGATTHRVFRVGQKVRVEVERVNQRRREIDFSLKSIESADYFSAVPKKEPSHRKKKAASRKRKKKANKRPFYVKVAKKGRK